MKSYKPTSNPRRQMTTVSYGDHLTVSKPYKPLTKGLREHAGRNSFGRITAYYKGSGNKKNYRQIDFTYNKIGIPAVIKTVEYDPYRTAFISLVAYKDGEKRYVILPKSLKVGDTFMVSEKAELKPGNGLPLKNIPVGTLIYNIEVKPKGGAKLVRAAGNYAKIIAHDGGHALIKMPSTEVRKVNDACFASVGEVSNDENWLTVIGKAGRSRWLGIRPKVRASAKNPVDHPYGGGEQKSGRGRRRAITRTGRPVGKGQKSRHPKKYSNIFIVQRRQVGKNKGEAIVV